MMRAHHKLALYGMLTMLLSAASQTARADFMFVSQSAVYDPSTQNVSFTLQFNQAPDFTTRDQYGRPADSFQYYIVGNPTAPYPANYDSIVREGETSTSGNELRIRNSVPPSNDPGSGGWGSIRGTVPFSLQGDTLYFSASLSLLSDHSVNGEFPYVLETYQYGAQSDRLIGQSTITPELPTFLLLSTGLLGITCAFRRRLQ